MFDIGFPELALASIVALLVLGPERLPAALRTLGLWLGRLRRSYNNVKTEIEREIGMDDVRRQLHNEQIMSEVERMQQDVKNVKSEITDAASGMAPGELADHPDIAGGEDKPSNSISTTSPTQSEPAPIEPVPEADPEADPAADPDSTAAPDPAPPLASSRDDQHLDGAQEESQNRGG